MGKVSAISPSSHMSRLLIIHRTWQDADSGYTKPSIIPYRPYGILQVPSNVVRISRALRRQDFRGMSQIISYHSGVGSGPSVTDKITGGLTGAGITDVNFSTLILWLISKIAIDHP